MAPDEGRVLAVPDDGGAPTTFAELPFPGVDAVAVAPDGTRVVCSVPEGESDIWVVESFDP
jgi:hypothetical protein